MIGNVVSVYKYRVCQKGEFRRCSNIHQELNSELLSSTQFNFFFHFDPLSLSLFNSPTKRRNHEIQQRERERERSLHQFSYADPSSPSSPRLKPWHQISTCTPHPTQSLPSRSLFREIFFKFSIYFTSDIVGTLLPII